MQELVRLTDRTCDLVSSGTTPAEVHDQLEKGITGKASGTMSRKLSVQIGDGTMKRTLARLNDWRQNIIKAEEKRLRRTILDM